MRKLFLSILFAATTTAATLPLYIDTATNTVVSPDAPTTIAGYGITDVITKSTKTVTADYNVLVTDYIILADDPLVGVDLTVTLPSAAVAGDGWGITIKKLGVSGDLILATFGSETIDGDASRTIRQKLESTYLVSDGVNWRVMFPTIPTGWAFYDDEEYTVGLPLTILSGVRTQITIDGLGPNTNKDYLPAGVTDFWSTTTDEIIGVKIGDAYNLRLDFVADPSTLTESILIELDIGSGSPIVIVSRSVSFSESQPQSVSVAFPIFTLSTFLSNGGKLYITPSANFTFYDFSIFLVRDFSPL